MAVGGAIALNGLRPRLAVPALAALVVCSLITVQLLLGWWRETIEHSRTTADQYWSHVGGRESLFR